MQHVMIDFETLGTDSDAIIMSIGAVKFDLDSDRIDDAGFYASISIDSNNAAGRSLTEDTLLWWLKQSSEAQAVFFEPKQSLDSVLADWGDWFSKGRSKFIWSNGASFDIAMLSNAYRGAKLERPWEFYDERCVRTFKNLPGAKNVKVDFPGVKHNALHDCIYQVRLVQAIQKKLGGQHPMVKTVAP